MVLEATNGDFVLQKYVISSVLIFAILKMFIHYIYSGIINKTEKQNYRLLFYIRHPDLILNIKY